MLLGICNVRHTTDIYQTDNKYVMSGTHEIYQTDNKYIMSNLTTNIYSEAHSKYMSGGQQIYNVMLNNQYIF